MRNLSDFKKRLQVGTKLETYNHNLKASFGVRSISIVQTNSFALDTIRNGETVKSWCEYPKASEFEIIDNNTALIYWGTGEKRQSILTYKFID
jgi:hypothetical protein